MSGINITIMEACKILRIELTENITKDTVIKAYRSVAREYHSDKTGGSDEKMSEINSSRDKLINDIDNGKKEIKKIFENKYQQNTAGNSSSFGQGFTFFNANVPSNNTAKEQEAARQRQAPQGQSSSSYIDIIRALKSLKESVDKQPKEYEYNPNHGPLRIECSYDGPDIVYYLYENIINSNLYITKIDDKTNRVTFMNKPLNSEHLDLDFINKIQDFIYDKFTKLFDDLQSYPDTMWEYMSLIYDAKQKLCGKVKSRYDSDLNDFRDNQSFSYNNQQKKSETPHTKQKVSSDAKEKEWEARAKMVREEQDRRAEAEKAARPKPGG